MAREVFSIMGLDPGSQHRTLAIAAIALGKIVELELPADPQSYELWYAYAAGHNQKLRDEIDHILQQQGELSESDLGRLHAQYLSATRNTGDFERVARRLADEVEKVNDQFGHQMGDDVLRMVAARLKSSVRDGEIARYGGEEFAVILYNKSAQIGKLIAERIRVAIESAEMRVRSTGASIGRVTVSIGVSQLKPRLTAADMIRSADDALYAAKRKGRNCVILEDS